MSITHSIPPAIQPNDDEIEIRLSDVVQFLKDSRRSVISSVIVFVLLGLLYSLSKQDEFTATVQVMPELKGSGGSGGLSDLKSLAGLAGVNIDNSGAPDAIRPDLYPDIVQSIPFTLYLLNTPVGKQSSFYSLQSFLVNQSSNGLMGWLGSKPTVEKTEPPVKNNNTLRLTKQQEELSKQLNKRVNAAIDKKSGIITITSVMPDPVVAATIAQQTLTYLTNYVTSYRTGKSRHQVQFLNRQVNDASRRYEATEYRLSNYRDRNRALFLNTAKIEEQRLQADYLLAQSVFNDLSKQLEQARIKVQEEAPVFQVLEPARIPLRKSAPNRTVITLGSAIFGLFAGLLLSFIRRLIKH